MITVIINFHREGHLAYLAARSAILASRRAERQGVPSRIIAVIDKGDSATGQYVYSLQSSFHTIHEVEFGDVSQARNFAIEGITTKYMAILDGDDLYSPDWLWKGVLYLEKYGDETTVGHAQARLTFGSEMHGRLQIPADHCFFHPLHLIASWLYASDFIAPAQLFKKYPYEANRISEGFGAEDWFWTCESLLEGIKHVIIPETSYFYRRILNRISLGTVPGTTFRPTRLLDKDSLAGFSQNYPSASIPLTQFSESIKGPGEYWNESPDWLRDDILALCGIDLHMYQLYSHLDKLRIETPAFYPGLNHVYRQLMDLVCPDSINVVVFCESLTTQDIGLLDSFARSHARRSGGSLNICVVCVGGSDRTGPDSLNPDTLSRGDGINTSCITVQYLGIGAQPSFTQLWENLKITLLIRFLLQSRPAMTVNLDSWLVDKSIGIMGKALASSGVRTVRVCRGKGLDVQGNHIFYSWYWFEQAQNNYRYAVCENVEVAGWLQAYFMGNGCRVLSGVSEDKTGNDPELGKTLYRLLQDDRGGRPDNTPDPRPAGSMSRTKRTSRTNSRTEAIDISCVVTVQNEGHSLNQTIHSIAAAQQEAHRQGIRTELIVVASSPSKTTQCILDELENTVESIHVERAADANIGQGRNLGIGKARGLYIACFTGTDIVSQNWLTSSLRTARQTGRLAVHHPEIVLSFRETLQAALQPGMGGKFGRFELLAFRNPWASCCFAHRDVFLRTPYSEASADSGFGHPEWLWNCDTIANDHDHTGIEGTFIYDRGHCRDRLSQQALGARQFVTLPRAKYFSEHPWLRGNRKKRTLLELLMAGKNISAALRESEKVHRALAEYSREIAQYEPLLMTVKPGGQTSQNRSVQTFARAYITLRETAGRLLATGILKSRILHGCLQVLRASLKKAYVLLFSKRLVAEIGEALNAKYTDETFQQDQRYVKMAEVYRLLRNAAAGISPTHIFIVPSLRPGGAEQHAIYCIQAVSAAEGNQVLLIMADGSETDWQKRLPGRCTCLPFAAVTREMDPDDKIEILTRLLVNIDADVLHLINSSVGWKALERYAPAITHKKRLYISLFSIPPAPVIPHPGYAGCLGPLLPYLSCLLTDNEKMADSCRTLFGLPDEKVCKLNHPVQAAHRFHGPSRDNRIVLWAGRLDTEKRPGLLMEIAGNLSDIEFHVYGTNVLGDDRHIRGMLNIPNIRYCGKFAGIDSIRKRSYGIFLHTSVWEGMPNMILEAMKSGLLVIAPDVGGIEEVVGSKRGVLIKQHETFHGYVAAIRDGFENAGKYREFSEQGRVFVTRHYHEEGFTDSLQHVAGYLG